MVQPRDFTRVWGVKAPAHLRPLSAGESGPDRSLARGLGADLSVALLSSI
jgi:hypothetical protein